jgi:hypothetical protein
MTINLDQKSQPNTVETDISTLLLYVRVYKFIYQSILFCLSDWMNILTTHKYN